MPSEQQFPVSEYERPLPFVKSIRNRRAVTTLTLAALAILAVRGSIAPTTAAVAPAAVTAIARNTAPTPRIVDARAPSGSCADQTWPYIQDRCLKRVGGSPPVSASTIATANIAPAEAVAVQPPAHSVPAPVAPAEARTVATPRHLPQTAANNIGDAGSQNGEPSPMRIDMQNGFDSAPDRPHRRHHPRHFRTHRLFRFF